MYNRQVDHVQYIQKFSINIITITASSLNIALFIGFPRPLTELSYDFY